MGTLRGVSRARAGVVAILGVLAVACATAPTVANTPTISTSIPTTTADVSSVTVTTTTTLQPTTSTTAPTFHAEILAIDDQTAARMTFSWREGCPVGLDRLRLLKLSFHDLNGGVQSGELVVNADVADDVVAVFEQLFDAGFPIEQMKLVDVYGGDDDASMAANNTSGFNCRYVDGTSTWSQHAFGLAVDINPLLNPWIHGSTVDPMGAEPYVDRSQNVQGMIHGGDVVVQAFSSIGWTWGGTWVHSKDYQHFSSTGQ